MEEEDKNKGFCIHQIGIIALVLIVLILVSNYFFVHYVTPEGKSVGEFGDMFGGVNALFSGLAFVGVIIAIMMQSKELELQREELKQTREELKGQKKQLQLQNETMQKQQFENTFFQMLKLHNDHMNDDIARNALNTNSWLTKLYGSGKPKSEEIRQAALNEIARRINLEDRFYSYLKVLHNILNFVEKSSIEDKIFYIELIKSEIGEAYLTIVHYYLVTSKGQEMFSEMVDKYKLLENLNFNKVIKV